MPTPTVRDATLAVLRDRGLTTMFSNPGSTEVPFLVDLPPDFDFVLALHEGSVVGMASGWAIGRESPALVLLHTTAGLGNAAGALATARVNRAPLVVIVGQQDRRHLALDPFLAGRGLDRLAGEYPVWTDQPVRPQDVPGAVARACNEAVTGRGPALVIVPMSDWDEPMPDGADLAAARTVLRPPACDDASVGTLAALLEGAEHPALVVGAGADDRATWTALEALADRLACPVYQEPFGARAGFRQDHERFAGHLPADRGGLREVLAGHDAVLAVGAPVFRQYPHAGGPLFDAGTRVALISEDRDEAHRSPVELAVLGSPAAICRALAVRVARREPAPRAAQPPSPLPPAVGDPLSAGLVLAALARRLPPDTVVVEETPSSRSELHALLPARAPLGFLSAAMGGLGFALPAAAGLRLAAPDRPVVAVVGDGSALYQVQALWSAARYGAGVLYVVLANHRYAIMDRLAETAGGAPPWPDFEEVDVAGLATAFGCRAQDVDTLEELDAALDDVLPGLADRRAPIVLVVRVPA